MRILNCLIVEDEPLAAGLLKDYVEQVPGLALKGICSDVFSANEMLRAEKIDVIFLDIHLPKMNGMDFLKTLGSRYHIILTTAYHQYAVDGFNLNATDYLLKPIEFSRFLQAINKVYDRDGKAAVEAAPAPIAEKFYFFNSDKKRVKLYASEICYIESLKDYVSIHSSDRKVITKLQIGEMDKLLEDGQFIRIHRSFIVNASKVTAYSATEIELGDITLPLGRTYKELVERRLKG